MKNIRLLLAYDGTNFLGWQKTKMGPSIEEALEAVLKQIFQEDIHLQAASRTDAGVHARGQVVNFFTKKKNLDFRQLHVSINSLLPGAIAAIECSEACANFHPTLNARSKEYRYYICNSTAQYPEHRNFSWHCPHQLDIEAMRESIQYFIGTHDFAAFCNVKKNEEYSDTFRTLYDIAIDELPKERLCIKIFGNKFLYKMVRNLVGTLVYVGRGKISLEEVPGIIAGKKRQDAGVTAPAHGLFLHHVTYPDF